MKQLLTSIIIVCISLLAVFLVATKCSNNDPWANELKNSNTLFTNFSSEVKTLDPANSYYSHEGKILGEIYSSLLTYHYLKRPYELEANLCTEIPKVAYFDAQGNKLEGDPDSKLVARAEYLITLKKGIKYQPHPCFVKNEDGSYKYRNLTAEEVKHLNSPNDFAEKCTRDIVANDFAVQFKRLADGRLASPVFSNFESFILGFKECSSNIEELVKQTRASKPENLQKYDVAIDYSKIKLDGIEIIDDYTFKIILPRKYPMALYWMAMHFVSPIPQEAIDFYYEPALIDKQIVLKNWPISSGPYIMSQFDPQRHIVLERNTNFNHIRYPSDGASKEQIAQGLLKDAGKQLPFIDKIIFVLERESIPSWLKFLQGYFDLSGIAAESFDQAITTSAGGDMGLSDNMLEQGIELNQDVQIGFFYFAFNMDDPVVGGYTADKIALRQAISIALDFNEFIDIFLNGRGISAQGPIPPGIFGYVDGKEGVNSYTDKWDEVSQSPKRQDLKRAKQLLAEAGYPNGKDAQGQQLVIYYDHGGGGSEKQHVQWFRKCLGNIGIDLQERSSDLNRFREKKASGNWQTLLTGWLADYPDAENFLFLFYSPNAQSTSGGPNTCNYRNAEFDKLFAKLETMNNTVERKKLIQDAVDKIQQESPVCWGFSRMTFSLTHRWLKNYNPIQISNQEIMYRRIDWQDRSNAIKEWNKPNSSLIAKILAGFGLLFISIMTIIHIIKRRNSVC